MSAERLVPLVLVAAALPLSARRLRELRPDWLQRQAGGRQLVVDWPRAREWFLLRYGAAIDDLASHALATRPALVVRLRELK